MARTKIRCRFQPKQDVKRMRREEDIIPKDPRQVRVTSKAITDSPNEPVVAKAVENTDKSDGISAAASPQNSFKDGSGSDSCVESSRNDSVTVAQPRFSRDYSKEYERKSLLFLLLLLLVLLLRLLLLKLFLLTLLHKMMLRIFLILTTAVTSQSLFKRLNQHHYWLSCCK